MRLTKWPVLPRCWHPFTLSSGSHLHIGSHYGITKTKQLFLRSWEQKRASLANKKNGATLQHINFKTRKDDKTFHRLQPVHIQLWKHRLLWTLRQGESCLLSQIIVIFVHTVRLYYHVYTIMIFVHAVRLHCGGLWFSLWAARWPVPDLWWAFLHMSEQSRSDC